MINVEQRGTAEVIAEKVVQKENAKVAMSADWREPKEPTIPVNFHTAARFLNVRDKRTVTSMANRGEIAARKIGRKIVLDLEDISDLNPAVLKEATELSEP